MGFGMKLVDGKEEPVLMCDTCGEQIGRWSKGKAVGTKPAVEGEVKTITFCHQECTSSEPNAISLAEYLGNYAYTRGTPTRFAKAGSEDTIQMTVPKSINMI